MRQKIKRLQQTEIFSKKDLISYLKLSKLFDPYIVIDKIYRGKTFSTVHCSLCDTTLKEETPVVIARYNDVLVNINLFFCNEQCKDLFVLQNAAYIKPSAENKKNPKTFLEIMDKES